MNRTEILKKANECVMGDREQDYGSPERNFELIAGLWSTYLDTDISAVDVAMMMAMLKVARVKSGRLHEDNFIDGAGYFACAGEIAGKDTDVPSEKSSMQVAILGEKKFLIDTKTGEWSRVDEP